MGSNMYCFVCGGPTSDQFCDKSSQDSTNVLFTEMPGLSLGDVHWIQTSVVVYADCISPPGQYDWSSISAQPYEKSELKRISASLPDPVHLPDWAYENQPGRGNYDCSEQEDAPIAHELCIRLAAEWSKAWDPSQFDKEATAYRPVKVSL
ncbi:hypothetical protein C8J56DRAFT_78220 [Mycena floridula]|nr:hypothetical protein C8J56DRAFT_78220 [Mycena floridula]